MGIYVKYSYWPKKDSAYDFTNLCEASELLVPEILIPSKEVAQDVISKLFSRRDVIVTAVSYAAIYVGEIKLSDDFKISEYPDVAASTPTQIQAIPAQVPTPTPTSMLAPTQVVAASVPKVEHQVQPGTTEEVVAFINKRFPGSSYQLFRKEYQFFAPVDKSLLLMDRKGQLKNGKNIVYSLTVNKKYQILARVASRNRLDNILLNDDGKMIFAPEEDFTSTLVEDDKTKDPTLIFPGLVSDDDDGDIRSRK